MGQETSTAEPSESPKEVFRGDQLAKIPEAEVAGRQTFGPETLDQNRQTLLEECMRQEVDHLEVVDRFRDRAMVCAAFGWSIATYVAQKMSTSVIRAEPFQNHAGIWVLFALGTFLAMSTGVLILLVVMAKNVDVGQELTELYDIYCSQNGDASAEHPIAEELLRASIKRAEGGERLRRSTASLYLATLICVVVEVFLMGVLFLCIPYEAPGP